ncbi:RNA-binding region RNP-1 domain-containing protein [Planoprotostelium fungivorum]|uniref:RNA-binding region RNP-1 domain-containing protein n=1 Tax=Planoprotostelium fungivorum TaxID=1890364 RepID=A0A2P6P0P7_9EUKA|nr:RNA-binding region RNP-1 domain-containing protein [Planoprotostelium fungivorum]
MIAPHTDFYREECVLCCEDCATSSTLIEVDIVQGEDHPAQIVTDHEEIEMSSEEGHTIEEISEDIEEDMTDLHREEAALLLGNLPYQMREKECEEIFIKFGKVTNVTIGLDRRTGMSRGYAFVEFLEKESAQKAAEGMNNFPVEGRNLRVNFDLGIDNKRPPAHHPLGGSVEVRGEDRHPGGDSAEARSVDPEARYVDPDPRCGGPPLRYVDRDRRSDVGTVEVRYVGTAEVR